ncbi:MAG: MupA/Atu3671 family FMN-dependent luciferase-like monooxygenase [Limisphaerales bacterium]
MSINWPLWQEGGMKAGGNRAEALGLVSLDRESGWKIFTEALASGEAQVWGCVGNREKIQTRLLDRLAAPASAVATAVTTAATGSDAITRPEVTDYLTRQFSVLTKLPLGQIHADEPIENFGIDSIMVAGFAQMLEQDLGELSKTLLFEYQTLEALADYLLKNYSAPLTKLLKTAVAAPRATEEKPREAKLAAKAQRFRSAQPVEGAGPVAEIADKEAGRDDIAIIGVFGRYPMADDLEEFWANLAAGKDCIEEVPRERWDYQDHYDAEPGKPGKTSNKWGGFIRDVDKFDALFFNISPREAQFMDPQERIFLEAVWKTLEDAGYSKSSLNERKVGVFVGVMYAHYQLYGVEERLKGNPVSLSSSFATIANRVSYFFNWHGPSLAVDTMCSSSLTSIHLACESLKRGECELAVAGGVNTSLHPEKDIVLSQSYFTASDGRCKTFGDGGDGYVPGEGVGALLLKPLARARADHDQIYGVIKASSLNHGGKTNGYTVPNSKSQTEVVLDALRKAKVAPASITYLEAHGTGTSLGDPIEITGLQQAFTEAIAEGRTNPSSAAPPSRPFCAIGSVKSNIGHCESAAGIAGVTKVLLQMRHKQLVPSLHAETLNPHIRFEETFFRVQRRLEDWAAPCVDGKTLPRRAGVSSFGAGGANAHLIVEEYLEPAAPRATGPTTKPVLVVLSAKNEKRLRALAANLAKHFEARTALSANGGGDAGQDFLRDAAFTLQAGREALEERLALVTCEARECAEKLRRWADAGESNGLFRGNAKKTSPQVEELRGAEALEATVGSLLADEDLAGLARLWTAGAPVDWQALHGESAPRRISLPTYPFARQRHWVAQASEVAPGDAAQPRKGNGSASPVRGGNSGNGHQDNGGNGRHATKSVVEAVGGNGHHPRATGANVETNAAGQSALDFSIMFFSDNSQVAAENKYHLVLEAARFADQHGFAAIWTPERHFHPFGGIYSSPASLTAALAMITGRIRLRAGSVVLPLEDPLRVVEAWSVVDNLSRGRVDIAFASGWHPNDFALAPEIYPKLRQVWLDRIPEIQRLWRGEAVERINGKGELVKLQAYPRPCQKELPVWLTASRRLETFIDAGQRGYHVLTMLQGSTLAQLGEKIGRYREARQQAGWDPRSGKVTLMLHTLVHPDAAYAQRLVRKPFLEYIRSSLDAHMAAVQGGDRVEAGDFDKMAEFSYERYCRQASLIGDPAGCLDMVRKCREIGVDEIACLVDFGADADAVIASLPHLAELRRLSMNEPELLATAHDEARAGEPGELLPAASRGTGRGEADEPEGCFLTPDWIESEHAAEGANGKAMESLLLIHSGELPLHQALVDRHHAKSMTRIRLGNQTRSLTPLDWEVDVEDPHAWERCLPQIPRPDLIYFTGAMGLEPSGDETVRVDTTQKHGALAFARLVQAMDRLGWLEAPPAIKAVTAGAFEMTPGDRVSPYGASLSGLIGSLAKEHSRLEIACVDVDPREFADATAVQSLGRAIAAEPAQRAGEKIALRGGRRLRLRLRLTEMPAPTTTRFRAGGVYLILGGAGNVSFHLSEYLARTVGAKLIWVGRRPLDARIEERIGRIETAGGEALYLQAWGENLEEMRRAFETAQARFGPLNGVIHSALVYQGEFLRRLDDDTIQHLLNSKTKASAVLFELTRDLPLDFLLFLGSAQSFFNEARRGLYAAGCCFVDAYARFIRQRVAFPVHVMNWGFWSHSFDAAIQQTMRSAGLGVIQPEDGMRALEQLLEAGVVQAAFLKARADALARMGIDPGRRLVCLPKTEGGLNNIETLIAAKLFHE